MPPRPVPTHFLCLPLVTGTSRLQLSTSLSTFSTDVTSPDSFAIPEQAVRPLGTLHLTIGVMSFPKDEGLEKAVELLKTLVPSRILGSVREAAATILQADASADPAVTKPTREPGDEGARPPPLLPVTLKGLHSMQPSASKASVLYAPPVDTDGTLRRFCEHLRSVFQEAGLMTAEERPLLLHATIVNTIYVKGRDRKGKGKGKGRDKSTIDARGILDRYDDFVWVEDAPLDKIAICRMGAKKQDDGDEAPPDKRRGNSHAVRASGSSRSTSIISVPPRAQLTGAVSSSPSPGSDHNGTHDATTLGGKDGGTSLAAKEKESALLRERDDRIAELERELATMEVEFSRELDRLSQKSQPFLRADTELRLLRAEVEVKEAERAELREGQAALQRELRERDEEIRSLRGHIAGLKQWVSTSTTRGDQASDEEFGDAMAKLGNGLQNWVIMHFRRAKLNFARADEAITQELDELVPMYEKLAAPAKVHLLQSVVSSILVEAIFNAYFVGLAKDEADRLARVERDLASLTSAESVNQWRAMTLTMLRKEATSRMRAETALTTESVITKVNRIFDAITDANTTDARDQALRTLVNSSVELARLLVVQKATFKVHMPRILAHQMILFEPSTMEDIGAEDEESLTDREICCVAFPGLIKIGDENGSHPQFTNVVAKARVLCEPK
ncbi:RNA ligase-like domain-containing protein [Durotheca rogersii]|uniref:RNA ligase-like domain-containing protein n=1 Tax=Durotheca rogersii TaxID=419775 RepID=UPI00221E69DB|nr:RNA ligase-like domain-containing protein [Durotheca rogersii]KAI5862370.1 RNA ligase-like domain-containing protein [Durotheca rogersii]